MNYVFARVSGARATAVGMTADAGLWPGSVPARSASKRLRPSQQPPGAPARSTVIQVGGMRPSQSAGAAPGVLAAVPPVRSAWDSPSAGLRPSQGGLPSDVDGRAELRIQRCGIGSSCDCPPHEKLAGINHDLQRATAAGGAPLAAASRARMERAFSSDFAAVRVHTSSAAHDAASALAARALTAGTDILFRAGEYQPGTPGGDRLLAHELAHVVQQAHGLPQGALDPGATGQWEKAAGLAADHASPAAEREAHGAAMMAAIGGPMPALSPQPRTIARQGDVDGMDNLDAGNADTTAVAAGGTSLPAAAGTPSCAGWESDPQSFSIRAAQNFAQDAFNTSLSTPDRVTGSGKLYVVHWGTNWPTIDITVDMSQVPGLVFVSGTTVPYALRPQICSYSYSCDISGSITFKRVNCQIQGP